MKPSKSDSKTRDPGMAPSLETIEEVYRKFKNDTGGYTGLGPHNDYNKKSPRSAVETAQAVPSSSGALPTKRNQFTQNLGSPKRTRTIKTETKTSFDEFDEEAPQPSSSAPRVDANLGKSMDTQETALSNSVSEQEEESDEVSMLSDDDNLSFEEKDSLPPKRAMTLTSGSTDKERLTAKEKNREHARNTRIRKKNYIEALKESIQQMTEERERVDRERKIAFSRFQEHLAVRKRVLQEVLDHRASGVLDANVWNSLLEDTIVLVLPVTPYRSFPPLEVYQGQRYVRGIPAVILDTSSFYVMLQTLVPPVNTGKKMKTIFACVYEDAVFQDYTIMCPFEMKTKNGLEVGCRCDLSVRGMIKAVFSPYNKLLFLELIFDVMMLMQQIRRASGRSDFLVVPNSPYLAQEQPQEGRVITESMPPYRIVYVSEGWQHLFGFRREQIIGKTCRILQGERTEKEKVAELMEFVKAFLPCNTIITNYTQSGEMFPNWIRIFPLYQDGVVSHFLGIMENLNHSKLPAPIMSKGKGGGGASYQEMSQSQILGSDLLENNTASEASIIKTARPTQGMSSISLAFRQAQEKQQQRSQQAAVPRSMSLVQPTGENSSSVAPETQPSALTRRLFGSANRLPNNSQQSQGGNNSNSSSSAFRPVVAQASSSSPAPSASSILSNGKTTLTPSMTEEFLFAMFKDGDMKEENEQNSVLTNGTNPPEPSPNPQNRQAGGSSATDLENMDMSDGEASFDENLLSY